MKKDPEIPEFQTRDNTDRIFDKIESGKIEKILGESLDHKKIVDKS